jgi:hypothetical protein
MLSAATNSAGVQMKIPAIVVLILATIILPRNAVACDQDSICQHILWCLTNPTIDPNDVKNLNWSIDVGSGYNVRYNTTLCQNSRSPQPKRWDEDQKICGDDTMIGMARLARSNKCRPPPPPPAPSPHPGPPSNTCDVGDGITCFTTVPKDGVCYCQGREGISK